MKKQIQEKYDFCVVGGGFTGLCAKGAVNIRDIDINCLQNQLICDN